jgi:hypothetical protein
MYHSGIRRGSTPTELEHAGERPVPLYYLDNGVYNEVARQKAVAWRDRN